MSRRESIGRREFVTSSVAASGVLLTRSKTAFSATANSVLNLGLLGCGGRGNNVAGVFVEHTNTRIAALADLFGDRLEVTQKRFEDLHRKKGRAGVEKTFQGPNAFRELVNSDVDAVLITSPPYFHPEHLEAALNAGKHVYLEKPVATDVQGCRKVAQLSAKAEGKVSVDVGFQIRSGPHFVALTERLHKGAIGEIVCAQGFYFASDLPRKAKPGMSKLETRVRDWVFDRALGGDHLVEQNVHIVDVFNWVLKAHPLRASATAGRKVRTSVGDVSDHFVVTYHYPNDVRVGFMSTQFLPEWGTVGMRFFGNRGYSEAFYSGGLRIYGENPWEAGAAQLPAGTKPEIDPLKDATPEKVKAFVQSIREGDFHNQLKLGAESSLSAILGREAAYEGADISWGELLSSGQHFDAAIDLKRLV